MADSNSYKDSSEGNTMRGSGGTEGGVGLFLIGFLMSVVALWFFFDSVLVTSRDMGLFSGMMGGRGRGGGGHGGGGGGGAGWRTTTSMGILFVPFLLGTIVLFYNSRIKWAWWLMWIGIAILVIEILSRIRFMLQMKTSHLLGMFLLFAAGAGMMLRSYRDERSLHDYLDDSAESPEGQSKQDVT